MPRRVETMSNIQENTDGVPAAVAGNSVRAVVIENTPAVHRGEPVNYLETEKNLLKKSFPIVVNRMIVALGGFAGGILLAQFGEEELIACSYIVPTQMVLVVVGGASLNAVGVLAGRGFGAIQRLLAEAQRRAPHSPDYELCLRDMNTPLANNKLYVEIANDRLQYSVISPSGRIETGEIDGEALVIDRSTNIESLKAILPSILKITAKRGHTRLTIEDQKYLLSERFVQGSVLSLFTSIPAMVLMWYSGPIFEKLGISESTSNIIGSYFKAYMWGQPAAAWCVVARQYSLALNLDRMNIITGLAGLFAVATVGYGLTFGDSKISWLAFSPLKTAGFGYACTAQSWLNFVMYLYYFHTNEVIREYKPLQCNFRESFAQLAELWKVGWPVMIQIGGEIGLIFVNLALIHHFARDIIQANLAAQNILVQYQSLLITYPFGISQACSIMVGQQYGKKNYNEIIAVGKMTLLTSACISLLIFAIFCIARKPLSELFLLDTSATNQQEIISSLNIAFIIMSLGHVFDTMRHSCTGYLRGFQDTQIPMMINLAVLWVIGVSFSWLLGVNLDFGLKGLAGGNDIAIVIAVGLLMYRAYNKSITAINDAQANLPQMPVASASQPSSRVTLPEANRYSIFGAPTSDSGGERAPLLPQQSIVISK